MRAEATHAVTLRYQGEAPIARTLPGQVTERPVVRGKFLYVGDQKYWVKGVTYGTFAPDADGNEYHDREHVEKDFAAMAANGINTVRTYTVPPRWLLDIAQQQGLRVMIGLPWEQHVTFLDKRGTARSIEARVRSYVRACAGHPAVLCYTIGNEIPASIVRWHGRRRVEKFLHRLYQVAKREDPTALVTYVNFPTTEYLQLPFLDLVCFNVYLESRERLESYLARLQNLTDDRPLLMAEIGLDSLRNGTNQQAESLSWQVRTAFESGCCGAFVFAWTDQWHRGGYEIEDWDFGLTTRNRTPKPALAAVRRAFAEAPFPKDVEWPKVSVVVCSLNGSATIRDTLEGLQKLDYPEYEVIVVNDGSTDRTPDIASEYPVKLISTENRGLSNARNTGMEAAQGEIVAYIDDDAYPDPDWLRYLALTFIRNDYVGVGGPNLAPPGDGEIADCVANAPGGPVQVLLTDTVAEHIPGCNMAFRKEALLAIGGFDPRYRAAGDDVDLCWRLQERGGVIGFCASAMVWHHRRNVLGTYWKQQQGYGKAEALLEEKWPEKYNALGHTTWGGRLYGKGLTLGFQALGGRVYQGIWGSAPFQSMYQATPTTLWSLPLMPEWYLLVGFLGVLSLFGVSWKPLAIAGPLFILALALPMAQAVLSASRAKFTSGPRTLKQRTKLYVITAFMHLQQPLARLIGRLKHGLTPWRVRGVQNDYRLLPSQLSLWREQWEDTGTILETLQEAMQRSGTIVTAGGDYDPWDLSVRGGLFGKAHVLLGVEEHGGGKQLLKFRIVPRYSKIAIALAMLFGFVWLAAASSGAWLATVAAAVITVAIVLRTLADGGHAANQAHTGVAHLGGTRVV
jgi:GT2 family glycosyltransferase